MANTKTTTGKLGDTWDEPGPGGFVRRPDGTVLNVGPGGGHVLDVPGEYTIVDADGNDGKTITVKSDDK